MADDSDLAASALAANRAFYEAFESSSIEAMSRVWEQSERVLCTHPGWETLHGWSPIADSWRAIFNNQTLQFIITNEHVIVQGDTAVVSNDENLISGGLGGTVAALNVYVAGDDGGWRMIAHHGSSVMRSQR